MGLDVTAYERAEPCATRGDEDEDVVVAYAHPRFAAALEGLTDGRAYRMSGDHFHFRAGSYSGYNEWRAALCRVALGVEPEVVWESPNDFAERPFFLLINNSDCEGTIGPVAVARLAREFEEHEARITADLAFRDIFDWNEAKYREWQQAFRLAAGAGLVRLH